MNNQQDFLIVDTEGKYQLSSNAKLNTLVNKKKPRTENSHHSPVISLILNYEL
jgi:hypothetical protein